MRKKERDMMVEKFWNLVEALEKGEGTDFMQKRANQFQRHFGQIG